MVAISTTPGRAAPTLWGVAMDDISTVGSLKEEEEEEEGQSAKMNE